VILKKYEKIKGIIAASILLLISEIVLLLSFYYFRINTYHKYSSIIFSNSLIYLMLDNNELKDIYKNNSFYCDGKKHKLIIDHINTKVLKRDGKYYNQLFIKYKSINRDNEILDIILLDNKINIFEMFKIMWKEDV